MRPSRNRLGYFQDQGRPGGSFFKIFGSLKPIMSSTRQISRKREEREQIIQEICKDLREKLHEGGIEAVVEKRASQALFQYL